MCNKVDFTKLEDWHIRELVKKFGLESLEPLKALGVDFSKLSGWDITELVKKFGLESLEPLKALGVDFTKLEDWHITELVKKFGLEILEQLKDPGVLNTMENQELIQHFQPSSSMDANEQPDMHNYGNEQCGLEEFNPPDSGDHPF